MSMVLTEMMRSFGMGGLLNTLMKDNFIRVLDEMVLRIIPLRCVACNTDRVWKDGHGPRKNRIPVQRFECPKCRKKFCINTLTPWYRMKYPAATIILFVWAFLRGETINSLYEEVVFDGRNPSWSTIWRWTLKFGDLLIKNYGRCFVEVSKYRSWQGDETFFKIGGIKRFIIGTICPQTKKIFFTIPPKTDPDHKDVVDHLSKLMEKWQKVPKGYITDSSNIYPLAFSKIDEHIPHGTVNHTKYEFMNSKGQTTNAIENVWRQLKRYLYKKNGLKKTEHFEFHCKIFEITNNTIKNPFQMAEILLEEMKTQENTT